MRCEFCGIEQPAMKTVRPRSGGASGFACCDRCYAPLAGLVWIVREPVPCFGKCRLCSEWVSVNDLRERVGGGKWDSPTGVCSLCLGVE